MKLSFLFLLLFAVYIASRIVPTKRKRMIREIIEDLGSLKWGDDYAVQENLVFFQATRSVFTYFYWLITRAPKIDSRRLKELSDYPFPKWDRELHIRLVQMEKKKFPGMITPLRNAVVDFVLKNDPKVIVDLGSGGMEIERQLIHELTHKRYQKPAIFVGIDRSSVAKEVAKNNLRDIAEFAEIHEIEYLDRRILAEMQSWNKNKHTIVMCKNDIFQLDRIFNPKSIDLLFYSKFKHHLAQDQKLHLDELTTKLAKVVMEYDDYRSWPLLIPQSIATWPYPLLMNGAVFSRLRDPTKRELLASNNGGWNNKFFGIGSYLRLYERI